MTNEGNALAPKPRLAQRIGHPRGGGFPGAMTAMSSNPRIPFALSRDRPRLPAPGGKKLIVHVVVNVENWRFDHAMPRKLLTAPHGVESVPDVPNFSWAEYGLRCGMPRFLDAMGRREIPVSCAINAAAIEAYPSLAEAILRAGWEFVGHGLHQKSVQAEASEREMIAEALARLRAFTGKPVQGWLGPGLKETGETPDLLKAEGVRYCMDWVLDDLPCWMATRHGKMIAMPYTLEINDSVLHAVYQFPSDEMPRRLEATLAVFAAESETDPRVVTLGLHPHLMGVPHRFGFLEKMLDLLRARDDTIFMTGSQIADWYESVSPPEAGG